jgi:hypothetical protein
MAGFEIGPPKANAGFRIGSYRIRQEVRFPGNRTQSLPLRYAVPCLLCAVVVWLVCFLSLSLLHPSLPAPNLSTRLALPLLLCVSFVS